MNNLILILVLVVGLCYFGEKHCPAVLKQNKQILLGALIGLGSASLLGGVEGFYTSFIRMNSSAGVIEDYDADCCHQIKNFAVRPPEGLCAIEHERLTSFGPDDNVWTVEERVQQYIDECDGGFAVPDNIRRSLTEANQTTADYAALGAQENTVARKTQWASAGKAVVESRRNAALNASGLKDVYDNAEESTAGSGSQRLLDRLAGRRP